MEAVKKIINGQNNPDIYCYIIRNVGCGTRIKTFGDKTCGEAEKILNLRFLKTVVLFQIISAKLYNRSILKEELLIFLFLLLFFHQINSFLQFFYSGNFKTTKKATEKINNAKTPVICIVSCV